MNIDIKSLEMAANPSTFHSAVEKIIEISYNSAADERLKELAIGQMDETRQAVLYGDFLACDSFNVMDSVNRIRVPTLLICGSEDRMTPRNRSEYLREQIDGAKLHVVEGSGHMVMIERPDEVANLIAEFLDKIPY